MSLPFPLSLSTIAFDNSTIKWFESCSCKPLPMGRPSSHWKHVKERYSILLLRGTLCYLCGGSLCLYFLVANLSFSVSVFALGITFGAMLRCAFNITNFSAYKYINLIHVNYIFTTNCAMQYERLLAAGFLFLRFFQRWQRHTYWQVLARAVGFF